ncbi:MAG: DegT/DnrJ/EryC1/StrS family aminotransferase [Candidatus Helarchaeota archaeon]
MKVPWSIPELGIQEKEAVLRIIDSKWLSQGKETELFEAEISEYIGSKYTIVVNNGTSALIVSLLAHGIGRDDEVLVPTYTFIATINSILCVNAKPILVDCDPETFNTTPELMEPYITKKTKAILPVDVGGMPIDIHKFQKFADEHNLILIEDAAEGIGAKYKHKLVGNFDHTTIFSFHMAKLCTTVEGGCILTNDEKINELCRLIRNHGMKRPYDHQIYGLNFRITDIQSAIGRVQLKKLPKFINNRNKIAKKYMQELKNFVKFQKIPDYVSIHPWMIFSILVDEDKRDILNKKLNSADIETRICWKPAHLQPYISKYIKYDKYPNAEFLYKKVINLPIGNAMNEEQVDYVIEVLLNSLSTIKS